MPTNKGELTRRTRTALDAIKRSLGTEAGEYAATLFASHHLDELEPAYWRDQLGVDKPTPAQVLNLLRLQSHWSANEDDGIDILDFELPGDVSNYVLSVRFDNTGRIREISMES